MQLGSHFGASPCQSKVEPRSVNTARRRLAGRTTNIYFDGLSHFRHILYMEDDVIIEADGMEEPPRSEEELEATESRVENRVAKAKNELEQVKRERQEYLDGWQRAKADYVNALKRAESEKDAAKTNGVAKASQAFIGVLDTLERAEAAGEVPEAFTSVAKQLHAAATSLGLTKFGEVGEVFDPLHHEALGQDVVDTLELDETVTAVLEPGWKAGEEVIRPARVRVGNFEVST